MIHALLDTTQVVGTVSIDGIPHEVCAEAVASHDRSTRALTVNLRAFLRATQHAHLGEVATPSWLPASQTVTEHVEATEAHEMANDVFVSWKHKVIATLPA
jgi:hypothetical protein